MSEEQEFHSKREPLEKLSYAEKGRFYKYRQILNVIFILACIVGFITYFHNDRLGFTILIGAVIVKGVECVLRIIR